ncbi:MAG: glycosyltransferase [Mangrovibacterium sp.]
MTDIGMKIWNEISFWIENYLFWYAIVMFFLYSILAFISAIVLTRHSKEAKVTNYNEVLSSPYAPMVSILAPAYNEELNIYENVKALLSLYYANYEVVVINDGSSDATIDVVINEFDMELVDILVDNKIHCSEIRGVYRSRKTSLNNLVLVDKINGGKADALNAGINVSSGKYFVAIDADCVIDPYALQMLVKPFLADQQGQETIAVGGVIRIANSCVIEGGQLIDIQLPNKLLPLFQVIEYNRSFLMGRLAWTKLNGLLIISGALGMFNKEIVVECGGYSRYTVGEDMELVVRMRRYMSEVVKKPYKIDYLPDPLCWTEAPATADILIRQRNRWTRGTIETLFAHWNMFLNPKYGVMGMMSHPFWTFFEWFAPIIEFIGMLYFLVLAFSGQANWPIFLTTLTFIYTFALTLSSISILYDHIVYFKYRKINMVIRQLIAAAIEPFVYHPIVTYAALRGNWDYFILRKRNWGKMPRAGLGGKPQSILAAEAIRNKRLEEEAAAEVNDIPVVEEPTNAHQEPEKPKGKSKKLNYIIGTACFVLAAGFFWMKPSLDNRTKKKSETMNETLDRLEQEDIQKQARIDSASLKITTKTIMQQSSNLDIAEPEQGSSHQVSIVVNGIDVTLPYQLIVGSFNNTQNAENFIRNLKNRAINAATLSNINNIHFVTGGGFSSLQEAKDARIFFEEKYPDIEGVWIYSQQKNSSSK